MDWNSQHTVLRVQQNDASLKVLKIGYNSGFNSRTSSDFSTLGAYIGENTHLTTLYVNENEIELNEPCTGLFEGLKQNSSINELVINDVGILSPYIIGQDWCILTEILQTYQENNSHLTRFRICGTCLRRGFNVVVATLRSCTNLTKIELHNCMITDEQLLSVIEAVGEYHLEVLKLGGNRIGNSNDGCVALATLLEDPNSYLRRLALAVNNIDLDGATAIVSSLSNNTKLTHLSLDNNPCWEAGSSLKNVLSRLLANTSSISSTYSSNHTLEKLKMDSRDDHIDNLMRINRSSNDKGHVAMRKILKYHPNIDLEPLFEWNMEGDGEHNLKALPYVIAWFDRAGEAVAGDDERESYKISERKLTAVYQFAKAMPLLFVPSSQIKGVNNKRKREGM